MRKTLLLALLAVYTFHIKVTDARTALLANPHFDELKLSPEQLERAAHDRVMLLDPPPASRLAPAPLASMLVPRRTLTLTAAIGLNAEAALAFEGERQGQRYWLRRCGSCRDRDSGK